VAVHLRVTIFAVCLSVDWLTAMAVHLRVTILAVCLSVDWLTAVAVHLRVTIFAACLSVDWLTAVAVHWRVTMFADCLTVWRQPICPWGANAWPPCVFVLWAQQVCLAPPPVITFLRVAMPAGEVSLRVLEFCSRPAPSAASNPSPASAAPTAVLFLHGFLGEAEDWLPIAGARSNRQKRGMCVGCPSHVRFGA
jgi:hypothetical protein